MRDQYFLIEAIACPCLNKPRSFLSPTGRILLPMLRREKLVLSCQALSVAASAATTRRRCRRAVLHSFVNTCPPCGRASGPVLLAGWLQVMAFLDSHSRTWPLAPKQDHPARPRRAYSLSHMGNRTSLRLILQTLC